MEKLKIGVLLSGSGTNLQAIIDEIAEDLPVEIVHVLSSRPDACGIERARNLPANSDEIPEDVPVEIVHVRSSRPLPTASNALGRPAFP